MRRQAVVLILAMAFGSTACVQASEAKRPRYASAAKLCDSFGPGFVPAGVPGHCVKVQERLRVEPQGRRALMPLDGGPGTPLPDGTLPAHLRLNGGFGPPGTR